MILLALMLASFVLLGWKAVIIWLGIGVLEGVYRFGKRAGEIQAYEHIYSEHTEDFWGAQIENAREGMQ